MRPGGLEPPRPKTLDPKSNAATNYATGANVPQRYDFFLNCRQLCDGDNTEKVLRSLHVLLSKSEPYPKEPSKVIIDKQQVIDLLAELNTCIYQIMDEYELTIRSRDKAERDFHKKGDQIIWDASRKAEDIYAASVMYMDETLNRMQDIMQEADKKVGAIYQEIKEQMEKEEQELRTNKSELKGQLQDLVDTEKYLKIIEERNREIEKEKMEGRPEYEQADRY